MIYVKSRNLNEFKHLMATNALEIWNEKITLQVAARQGLKILPKMSLVQSKKVTRKVVRCEMV